jgi:hypothetical protein
MRGLSLHTVCEEAGCPNIYECWADKTATFMILGDRCVHAGFCLVDTPSATTRPRRARAVADAIAQLGLAHAVITSVARDDVPDERSVFASFDPRRACPHTAHRGRGAHSRLQGRPRGAGGGLRRPTRRPEPQPRDGRPAPAGGATVGGVLPIARAAGRAKDAGLTTKSGIILGMGETEGRAAARDRRPRKRRRRHPHLGPVPAPDGPAPPRGPLVDAEEFGALGDTPAGSGSPTWSRARSCVRATTPVRRRRRPSTSRRPPASPNGPGPRHDHRRAGRVHRRPARVLRGHRSHRRRPRELSPKGLDTFTVLDPNTVAYLDLTGSGIETVAHLRENGRITIMFCAFDGNPNIVRLYGSGDVLPTGRARRRCAAALRSTRARSVIRMAVRPSVDVVRLRRSPSALRG